MVTSVCTLVSIAVCRGCLQCIVPETQHCSVASSTAESIQGWRGLAIGFLWEHDQCSLADAVCLSAVRPISWMQQ